jgi:hypothetical protein
MSMLFNFGKSAAPKKPAPSASSTGYQVNQGSAVSIIWDLLHSFTAVYPI